MNPFESGMSQANGFHAVSTKRIAERASTKILNKTHSFFYNPSWSLMGDLISEPAGTYYYNKSGYDSFYWNLFDQVILRPSMIKHFDNDSYNILTDCSIQDSLLSVSGLPDRIKYSDHLPIKFKLKNL